MNSRKAGRGERNSRKRETNTRHRLVNPRRNQTTWEKKALMNPFPCMDSANRTRKDAAATAGEGEEKKQEKITVRVWTRAERRGGANPVRYTKNGERGFPRREKEEIGHKNSAERP